MKNLVRCLGCGESCEVSELVKDNDGDFACPTCESVSFIVIGDEDEKLFLGNELVEGAELLEELEDEEEDELENCTCIHCGDDFESDDSDDEVCEECQDAIDGFSNEDLGIALAKYFDCGVQDIVDNGGDEWQIHGISYKVYTESEADEECEVYIKDSLWAFNANFLWGETRIPQEMFQAIIDGGRCEDNNEIFEEVIEATCGMDSFVASAIQADGRGHFISSYDGEEHEIRVGGEYYYAYRD